MREWFNVLQYTSNWGNKDKDSARKHSVRRKRRASDGAKEDGDQGLSSKHLNKLKPLLMSNYSDTPLHTNAQPDSLDLRIGEKVERMASRVKNRASLPPPNKLHQQPQQPGLLHSQNTYFDAYDISKLDELRDNDANYQSVRALLKRDCNRLCADCRTPHPQWASHAVHNIPMVLFICIHCSGWHRSLGSHISKVKSVELDDWSADLIALADRTGNLVCNDYWERHMPKHTKIPSPTDSVSLGDFIRDKYLNRRWVDHSITFT
ncbi:hypothetical protein E3P99_03558 [Wallemia hederae]|uniref:Arf-GAP domain-containing protein n=1 Tax=Wallemia hederae TaxID=1540922 RepID=A0A4T0FET0_9BASI|nr:hypothetical protein E3P99_03558 [Wallemia hederae]